MNQVEEISMTDKAIEANTLLNEIPDDEKIRKEMKNVKDSAPGKDGVRMDYIRAASEEVQEIVIRGVQYMFENRAHKWDDTLKEGQIVPIFKKGERNERNNYRGVCLLAMGSRILGRVMAARLRWWAEYMGLTDDNQNGFRPGRSTADATQILVRIEEDVEDLNKRRRRQGRMEENGDGDPVARLLDLRKAYPRVSKPALWMILSKYGLSGTFLDTLKDLHETTAYMVRGREGDSSSWYPERGLREGCPTSPTLFNIYHQAVMRRAEEERRARAEEEGNEVGVEWRWQPGSSFPSTGLWEKYSSETETRRISLSLFADDTTIIGTKAEIERGVEVVKSVMSNFEEKNNDDKEEELIFGSEEGRATRMLGSWMGAEEDLKNRKKRAGALWAKVKHQLKVTKLSKRRQATIFEACVESALLFDCSVRTWYVKDVNNLQRWVDKCLRYLWSNKNCPPLRQMQREHKNMQDIRNELKVKSIRWKIEKRVLERIGHIMRMENTRQTKAAVLGWLKELETMEKCPGRKRKTVLYWKKLVREAGLDWTEIEGLTEDRDRWRAIVGERMKHLEEYERSKGHWTTQQTVENRNIRREAEEDELVCKQEGCGRRCKSRAGLKIHTKRMHKEMNIKFTCQRCGMIFNTENNQINHSKTCGGQRAEDGNLRRCEKCNRDYSKANIARHRRACTAREEDGGARGVVRHPAAGGEEDGARARVHRPRQKMCPECGNNLSAANMARHLRTCRGGRQ